MAARSEPLDAAFTAAVAAARAGGNGNHNVASVAGTDEDITTLFENAYTSLRQSLSSLSQWKASWDAAVNAAATQQMNSMHSQGASPAVDPSPAAAVAVPSDGQDQSMIPLILAAESKGSAVVEKKESGEVFSV
jgi:hypothetical protein